MRKIEFVWSGETGRYAPPPEGDDVRRLARRVAVGGSTADVRVYDEEGLVAEVMRPPSVYPWYIFDPFHRWKMDVIEWLTGTRPRRWEPLRFRCWRRQPDGSWKKYIRLP